MRDTIVFGAAIHHNNMAIAKATDALAQIGQLIGTIRRLHQERTTRPRIRALRRQALEIRLHCLRLRATNRLLQLLDSQ
jgi:hypothetical protein